MRSVYSHSITGAVVAVRDDLFFTATRQHADIFPEGFELSGEVDAPYARVKLNLVLSRGE